jgi:hypothetical protein
VAREVAVAEVFAFPDPKTRADYEREIDPILRLLRQHQEQMESRSGDIERLKAETRAMGVRTDSLLTEIDRLPPGPPPES